MRLLALVFKGLLLTVLLSACQGPPPTQYVLVVTATPDATAPATDAVQPTLTVTALPVTPTTPTTSPSATADLTPTLAVSATPIGEPTPTLAQIQVAEQIFQNGRMFWLQPTGQIWVMVYDEADTTFGVWTVHEDLFVEGDVEFDPKIVAPEGLLQPERGFGRLWRETPDLREALGWALEPELGHVSTYEYQPDGAMVNGEYVPAPGYHVLTSFYGDIFRFNEINSTWQTTKFAKKITP